MEMRNCSVKHFIRTIRGGMLIKASNIDSHGRPVSRSESLRDVYRSEDAEKLQKSPPGSMFDNKYVKHKTPCSLLADRTLWQIHPNDDVSSSADEDSDSDLDDSTTLSQLKNRVTKKRKYASTDENSNQDYASVQAVEDKSDLSEPLINLKPKHSKVTMAKIRSPKPIVASSATITVSFKSEQNLVSESSERAGCELAPVICVKSKVPDAEQLGSQIKMPPASSAGHNELLNADQSMHQILYANKSEECLTNEISYDHLEDIQPIPLLFPLDDSVGSSLVEIIRQEEISDSRSPITSCSDDPNADVICHSYSSPVAEYMPEECISGCHVPDMASDGCMRPHQNSNSMVSEVKVETNLPYELDYFRSSPGENCVSNLGSITTSSTKENPIHMKDDTIADEEQLSTSCVDTIMNELHSEVHTEDELLKALDKQNSALLVTCGENECSLEEIACDNADTFSTPEQHQLPERLFSTRKAFSPSTRERLCLAMKSAEIRNDSDQNIDLKCKGKLFENQTMKKPPSLRSEAQNDKETVNHRLPGQVSQRKVPSPGRIIKRSHIAKGNLEGPRFSRTLPNLSTACTSIQGCSESAVAFSQRQMQDMESIAVKLMNELKSMKDFIEQKFLFEAYRNVSIKNDADEVKSSIRNASKTEEMATKWLSMMARDCNRFCKIMKMMPDDASSKDTSPRGRKITFADEAGGELCHVRFFDDGAASPASNAIEQCSHQI